MKRRIAVFAIVWAYTLNALWIPTGFDSGYFASVFFPAYYYFWIGFVVAVAHESLARRAKRPLVTLALGALLFEVGTWMFGGDRQGHKLGLFFAAATVVSSLLAGLPNKIAAKRFWIPVDTVGLTALALGGMTFVEHAFDLLPQGSYRTKATPHYRYVMFQDNDVGGWEVYLTPAKTIFHWFGTQVYHSAEVPKKLYWEDENTLIGLALAPGSSGYLDTKLQELPSPETPKR